MLYESQSNVCVYSWVSQWLGGWVSRCVGGKSVKARHRVSYVVDKTAQEASVASSSEWMSTKLGGNQGLYSLIIVCSNQKG
jgi:hypothetical protein